MPPAATTVTSPDVSDAQMSIDDLASQTFQMLQLSVNLSGGSSRLTQPCSYDLELSLLFTKPDPFAEVVGDAIELRLDILDALEEIV